MRPDSILIWLSSCKPVTAVAIAQLWEVGRIDLDDPVSRHLPEFACHGKEAMTIRHLLTHTSGIKSYTSLGPKFWDVSRLDYQHDQLLTLFKDEPPDFQPGEKFLYNNSGYYLLGLIIEEVTGTGYDEYLRQTFFEPLGLRDTHYCWESPVIPFRARGYQPTEGGGVRNADAISMRQPYAAGALCSSVRDLARWDLAWIDK